MKPPKIATMTDDHVRAAEARKARRSELLAAIATGTGGSVMTLASYAGAGSDLRTRDLSIEMHRVSDEVESGDLGSIERLLTGQFMTLNGMFNDLAKRAARQDSMKNIEALTRLALKCQSQARATAETLALMKNPTPVIRQTNIASGPQQVNNGVDVSRARQKLSEPNELLERTDGQRLDPGAASTPGSTDQNLAAVEPIHRTGDRGG